MTTDSSSKIHNPKAFDATQSHRCRWATVILLGVTGFSTSCHSNSAESSAGPSPKPSTSEVFQLRSACARLAESLLKEQNDDLEPWINIPTYAWWHELSQVSRYNPSTNRCYVEITTRTTARKDRDYEEVTRELYDGQTKETLAMTRHQVSSGNLQKDEDTGMIYVDAPSNYDDTFRGASSYIDDAMKDDRKN